MIGARNHPRHFLGHFAAFGLLGFAITPILWIALIASTDDAAILRGGLQQVPSSLGAGRLVEAILASGILGRALANGVLVAGSTVALALMLTLPALGYVVWFGRESAFARNATLAIISARFFPSIVALPGLLWFEEALGLLDSPAGLIVGLLVPTQAFVALMILPTLATIRREDVQQAVLEGAGVIQIARRFLIPRLSGDITIVVLVSFCIVWNEYLLANMLSYTANAQTATVQLATNVGQFRIRYSGVAAGALVAMVPGFAVVMALLVRRSTFRHLLAGRDRHLSVR